MPQQMMDKEECFWLGQDLESGKALELGVPPPDVQTEEVGQWVTWGLETVLAQEAPPLAPLTEVP